MSHCNSEECQADLSQNRKASVDCSCCKEKKEMINFSPDVKGMQIYEAVTKIMQDFSSIPEENRTTSPSELSGMCRDFWAKFSSSQKFALHNCSIRSPKHSSRIKSCVHGSSQNNMRKRIRSDSCNSESLSGCDGDRDRGRHVCHDRERQTANTTDADALFNRAKDVPSTYDPMSVNHARFSETTKHCRCKDKRFNDVSTRDQRIESIQDQVFPAEEPSHRVQRRSNEDFHSSGCFKRNCNRGEGDYSKEHCNQKMFNRIRSESHCRCRQEKICNPVGNEQYHAQSVDEKTCNEEVSTSTLESPNVDQNHNNLKSSRDFQLWPAYDARHREEIFGHRTEVENNGGTLKTFQREVDIRTQRSKVDELQAITLGTQNLEMPQCGECSLRHCDIVRTSEKTAADALPSKQSAHGCTIQRKTVSTQTLPMLGNFDETSLACRKFDNSENTTNCSNKVQGDGKDTSRPPSRGSFIPEQESVKDSSFEAKTRSCYKYFKKMDYWLRNVYEPSPPSLLQENKEFSSQLEIGCKRRASADSPNNILTLETHQRPMYEDKGSKRFRLAESRNNRLPSENKSHFRDNIASKTTPLSGGINDLETTNYSPSRVKIGFKRRSTTDCPNTSVEPECTSFKCSKLLLSKDSLDNCGYPLSPQRRRFCSVDSHSKHNSGLIDLSKTSDILRTKPTLVDNHSSMSSNVKSKRGTILQTLHSSESPSCGGDHRHRSSVTEENEVAAEAETEIDVTTISDECVSSSNLQQSSREHRIQADSSIRIQTIADLQNAPEVDETHGNLDNVLSEETANQKKSSCLKKLDFFGKSQGYYPRNETGQNMQFAFDFSKIDGYSVPVSYPYTSGTQFGVSENWGGSVIAHDHLNNCVSQKSMSTTVPNMTRYNTRQFSPRDTHEEQRSNFSYFLRRPIPYTNETYSPDSVKSSGVPSKRMLVSARDYYVLRSRHERKLYVDGDNRSVQSSSLQQSLPETSFRKDQPVLDSLSKKNSVSEYEVHANNQFSQMGFSENSPIVEVKFEKVSGEISEVIMDEPQSCVLDSAQTCHSCPDHLEDNSSITEEIEAALLAEDTSDNLRTESDCLDQTSVISEDVEAALLNGIEINADAGGKMDKAFEQKDSKTKRIDEFSNSLQHDRAGSEDEEEDECEGCKDDNESEGYQGDNESDRSKKYNESEGYKEDNESDGCKEGSESEGCKKDNENDCCKEDKENDGCEEEDNESDGCKADDNESEGCKEDNESKGCKVNNKKEGCKEDDEREGCKEDNEREGCKEDIESDGCKEDNESEGCKGDNDSEGCTEDNERENWEGDECEVFNVDNDSAVFKENNDNKECEDNKSEECKNNEWEECIDGKGSGNGKECNRNAMEEVCFVEIKDNGASSSSDRQDYLYETSQSSTDTLDDDKASKIDTRGNRDNLISSDRLIRDDSVKYNHPDILKSKNGDFCNYQRLTQLAGNSCSLYGASMNKNLESLPKAATSEQEKNTLRGGEMYTFCSEDSLNKTSYTDTTDPDATLLSYKTDIYSVDSTVFQNGLCGKEAGDDINASSELHDGMFILPQDELGTRDYCNFDVRNQSSESVVCLENENCELEVVNDKCDERFIPSQPNLKVHTNCIQRFSSQHEEIGFIQTLIHDSHIDNCSDAESSSDKSNSSRSNDLDCNTRHDESAILQTSIPTSHKSSYYGSGKVPELQNSAESINLNSGPFRLINQTSSLDFTPCSYAPMNRMLVSNTECIHLPSNYGGNGPSEINSGGVNAFHAPMRYPSSSERYLSASKNTSSKLKRQHIASPYSSHNISKKIKILDPSSEFDEYQSPRNYSVGELLNYTAEDVSNDRICYDSAQNSAVNEDCEHSANVDFISDKIDSVRLEQSSITSGELEVDLPPKRLQMYYPPGIFSGRPSWENFTPYPSRRNFSAPTPHVNFESYPTCGNFENSPPPGYFDDYPSIRNFDDHPSLGNFEAHPSRVNIEGHPSGGNCEGHPSGGNFEDHPSGGNFEGHPSRINFEDHRSPGNFYGHSSRGNFEIHPSLGNFEGHPSRVNFEADPSLERFETSSSRVKREILIDCNKETDLSHQFDETDSSVEIITVHDEDINGKADSTADILGVEEFCSSDIQEKFHETFDNLPVIQATIVSDPVSETPISLSNANSNSIFWDGRSDCSSEQFLSYSIPINVDLCSGGNLKQEKDF